MMPSRSAIGKIPCAYADNSVSGSRSILGFWLAMKNCEAWAILKEGRHRLPAEMQITTAMLLRRGRNEDFAPLAPHSDVARKLDARRACQVHSHGDQAIDYARSKVA